MPRTARASVGGYCYHALNRGNGRAQVFHDPDDYAAFIRLVWQVCARGVMRVLRYCLVHPLRGERPARRPEFRAGAWWIPPLR